MAAEASEFSDIPVDDGFSDVPVDSDRPPAEFTEPSVAVVDTGYTCASIFIIQALVTLSSLQIYSSFFSSYRP